MIAALACLFAVAIHPVQASASRWTVTDASEMVWNGTPYSPVGLALDSSSPGDIEAAQKAGVKDFSITFPLAGQPWAPTVAQLEETHSRYFIKIGSAAKPTVGYDIDPEGYRLTNITADRHIHITLPGSQSVLLVFATVRDGEIESHEVVKTPDGVLDYDLHPMNDLNHVLLIYPLEETMQLPDLWQGADQDRDQLLNQIYSLKSTTGLRGIIDPLGYMAAGIPPEGHIVPTSPLFQAQFAQFLKTKYGNLNFVAQAWGLLMSDQSSFMDFARLVPLWRENSGAHDFFDPGSGQLVPAQGDRTTFWTDLRAAITQMASLRFSHVRDSIRAIVDVPVIQSWNGWSIPYEGDAEVDGVSQAVSGTSFGDISDSLAGPLSSVSRWTKPGWLMVDDFEPKSVKQGDTATAIDEFRRMNVQGLFFHPQNADELKLFASWSAKISLGPATKVSALYYPDAAENPAFTQRIGSTWWLPAPLSGGRLDLGSDLFGYRMTDSQGPAEVIWGRVPIVKETLMYGNPSHVTVSSLGLDEVKLRMTKEGVELNIGTLPLVIRGTAESPAPSTALSEMADEFTKFKKSPQFDHANIESPVYTYNEAVRSLTRTPGPAYSQMLDALHQLRSALGGYYWIPCTAADNPAYGKAVTDLSSCKGSVFSVRSNLNQPVGPFILKYDLAKLISEPVHVWVAISGTAADVKKVTMTYGRQSSQASIPGVAPYGYGYRWYDFGTISMSTSLPTIQLLIDNAEPVSLKFDSILLAPTGMYPSGPEWSLKQP